MTVLRDYQARAIDDARDLVNAGRRRIVLVAPCGAGKGEILAELIRSTLSKGNRVLALTHRRELVEDLAERVRRRGFDPGIIMPGHDPKPAAGVQVASIQTLVNRDKPVAQLVLVDECHHATAATWKAVLDCYPASVIIGSTATPCRMGGAPLGDLFEDLVDVVSPAALVDRGFLVPVQGFAYDAPDLRNVKRVGGDYAEHDLVDFLDIPRVRGRIIEQYTQRAPGSRALVFAVNVAHSEHLAAEFAAAGYPTAHLDGETPRAERARIFEAFRVGSIRVLCNVQLFTEGVDVPAIETVILARPTLSLSLALQMIGRGRRPVPCRCGALPHWRCKLCDCLEPVKKRCVRLHDHAGIVWQHGLPDDPRAWSLDTDFTVERGAKGKRSTALRTCRRCFAIYLADQPACSRCGYRNPSVIKVVRTAKGVAISLAEVERKARAAAFDPATVPEDKQRGFFLGLLKMERERGYKRGYAVIRFHAKFRHWPPVKKWTEEAT